MIKLLIADDHPIVRSGLTQIFATTEDIVVLETATQGFEVLERISKPNHGIDLLLLDMTMPGFSGVELIKRICIERPQLPILVLSMHNEAQVASRALKAGASGYLTKDSDPDILISAIRKVAKGGKFIDPQLVDALVFDTHIEEDTPQHILSEREFQVLNLLASGHSINSIGEMLNLSAKTISTHKGRLMEKLKLSNNAELFNYAMKHKLGIEKK
ncbi:MAG: response regulator transcription factor [Pseudomonadota bacterium]